jgi:hypothetical protein
MAIYPVHVVANRALGDAVEGDWAKAFVASAWWKETGFSAVKSIASSKTLLPVDGGIR